MRSAAAGSARRSPCTSSVYAWLAFAPSASVTWTVNEKLPAAVGVPLILPLRDSSPVPAGAMVRPAGRAPALMAQVIGVLPAKADHLDAVGVVGQCRGQPGRDDAKAQIQRRCEPGQPEVRAERRITVQPDRAVARVVLEEELQGARRLMIEAEAEGRELEARQIDQIVERARDGHGPGMPGQAQESPALVRPIAADAQPPLGR